MRENKKIIFLLGHSSAGKTRLGQSLSQKLNLPHFSIGKFVDACARKEGFRDSVELFRKKGTVESWNRLIPQFIEKIESMISNNGIIIDGPYSISVIEKVMQRFKEFEVFLYVVAAPKGLRRQRAKARFGAKGKAVIRERDKHRHLMGYEKIIRRFSPPAIRSKDPKDLQTKLLTALKKRQGLIRHRRA